MKKNCFAVRMEWVKGRENLSSMAFRWRVMHPLLAWLDVHTHIVHDSGDSVAHPQVVGPTWLRLKKCANGLIIRWLRSLFIHLHLKKRRVLWKTTFKKRSFSSEKSQVPSTANLLLHLSNFIFLFQNLLLPRQEP